jgi:hypothetical protein
LHPEERASTPFSEVIQAECDGQAQTTKDQPAGEQPALEEGTTPQGEITGEKSPETLINAAGDAVFGEKVQELAILVGQLKAINLAIEMVETDAATDSMRTKGTDQVALQQSDAPLKSLVQNWAENARMLLPDLEESNALKAVVPRSNASDCNARVSGLVPTQASEVHVLVESLLKAHKSGADSVVDTSAKHLSFGTDTLTGKSTQAQASGVSVRAVQSPLAEAFPGREGIHPIPEGEEGLERLVNEGKVALERLVSEGKVALERLVSEGKVAPGRLVTQGEATPERLATDSAFASEKREDMGVVRLDWKSLKREGAPEVKADVPGNQAELTRRRESGVVPDPVLVKGEYGPPRPSIREMGLQWPSEASRNVPVEVELRPDAQEGMPQLPSTGPRGASGITGGGATDHVPKVNGPFHLNYSVRDMTSSTPLHMLNLKVTPPDLGPLRMKVQVRGEEVRALFLTEAINHKVILDRGLHSLRQGLQEQGLSVQDLEVQVGTHSGGETSQEPLQNGRITFPSKLDPDGTGQPAEESKTKNQRVYRGSEGHILDLVI